VFEKPEFIAWANENIVFLVGYGGKSHGDGHGAAEGEGEGDGGKKEKKETKAAAKAGDCSLYPGLTCDDHERILKEATQGEGGPKLDCPGYPYSYMVAPDGTVEQHKKDRVVQELIDGVADFTKKVKLKPSKKYQGYLASLDAGDKARDAGKWKEAITAYQKVDAVAKKMPSLAAGLATRIDALNTAISESFQKTTSDEATDPVARIKAVKALRAQIGTKFTSGYLPVVADVDAWLKANPMPAPTAPAK
jgi:hypothetical protein